MTSPVWFLLSSRRLLQRAQPVANSHGRVLFYSSSYARRSTTCFISSSLSFSVLEQQQQQQQQRRNLVTTARGGGPGTAKKKKKGKTKKSVRIILQKDLPTGKAYAGQVIRVKPGYARNYLIPKKIALYAIRRNFERLGMKDPDLQLQPDDDDDDNEEAPVVDENQTAADVLRNYLRNKVLKIWRMVDPEDDTKTSPGMVTAKNVRQKLSKQLKIDLEPHENVHIVDGVDEMELSFLPSDVWRKSKHGLSNEQMTEILDRFDRPPEEKCQVEIRKLGYYLARISLAGDHFVPLKFQVVKR